MFTTPAYAQAAGAAGGSGGFLASMLPLIAIFVIFYFLLIRPQQKRAKEHKLMVENLRRGDQIVTSGGMLAKVTKVAEGDEVEVEIATGVKVKLIRSTITAVLSKTEPANDK
ncbi:MAG TPA: preprotein translocase subunit YajC [Thermohalobaculum sp.]|nr:preprotein translocase subunit YajC [Thermohalobaculum sp.]